MSEMNLHLAHVLYQSFIDRIVVKSLLQTAIK